jgi:hypothetical protein
VVVVGYLRLSHCGQLLERALRHRKLDRHLELLWLLLSGPGRGGLRFLWKQMHLSSPDLTNDRWGAAFVMVAFLALGAPAAFLVALAQATSGWGRSMSLVFIPQPGSCERGARLGFERLARLAIYGGAAVVSGMASATAVAAIGMKARQISGGDILLWSVASLMVSLGAVADLTGQADALPQRRRQVQRAWVVTMPAYAWAGAFGAILGTGFLTFLSRGAMYTVGALALLAPSPVAGASFGAVYGIGRVAPTFLDARPSVRAGRRPEINAVFGLRAPTLITLVATSSFTCWFALALTGG